MGRTIPIAGVSLLFLLTGLRLEGQFVPPTFSRSIDPQYDSSLKNYFVDPVMVTVIVDDQGNPFSLDSASPLPANVVRAIANARFIPGTQNGQPVPVSTRLIFGVRRPLDFFFSIAPRPSTDDPSTMEKAVKEGWGLQARCDLRVCRVRTVRRDWRTGG
jgi:hypothetical protein